MRKILLIAAIVQLSLFSGLGYAADNQSRMKVDQVHVKSWNHFAELCLDLHKKQINGRDIKQTVVMGGYSDKPDYYREVSYTDKKSGRLLSRIQWVAEKPDVVHSIEVFVYDNKGRVIRDYAAAFLPGQRNAPIQTLVNLHYYSDGLRAFRQFDGSRDVIYEYCEGSYKGKAQQIRLFEDDLVSNDYETRQLFKSASYKACFDGVPKQPGRYIRPQ